MGLSPFRLLPYEEEVKVREDWEAGKGVETAQNVVTKPQQYCFLAALVLAVLAALLAERFFTLLASVGIFLYLSLIVYKGLLVWHSLHSAGLFVTDREALSVMDEPSYTILCPLHHEGENVIRQLIRNLDQLDYDRDKLQILMVVDEDDLEDLRYLDNLKLESHYAVIRVPDVGPRSKPKACNVALEKATGEYLVIYDAEDHPESLQLKRAIFAFRNLVSPDVVCLQAKLAYRNHNTNLLTRWFTTDYATYFGLILPGMGKLGLPVPLGGTSNHFQMETLKEFKWDPWNMAEDADLGVRFARAKKRVLVLESFTTEEAIPLVRRWINQRSRWVKGYIQTYLVHMRSPRRLFHDFGFKRFLAFQMHFGVSSLSLLINPIYWGLTVAYFATRSSTIEALFPVPIFYLGVVCLLSNLAFLLISMLGCMSRGAYRNLTSVFLEPIYWFLLSVGAWRGVLQLWRKPHHWEHTPHGIVMEES